MRRTSGSSPCASRASTSSACSGRRGPRPCSRSPTCGRESRRRPAPEADASEHVEAYFKETGLGAGAAVRRRRSAGRDDDRRPGDPPRADDHGRRLPRLERRRHGLGNYLLELRAGRRGRDGRCGRRRLRVSSLRPRHARGDRQPARLDRPRNGEHAPAHRPLGGAEHGPRLLVRADHRRQPPARLGGGPAGARDRHGVPRGGDDRPARDSGRGRRVPAQRPVPRQHPSGRPCDPRPGLLGGPACVHSRRQGAPGRLRERTADDLHAVRARRLRGRQPDLPGGARAAGLPRRRRRDPHVPPPDPGAGSVVRRLPRDDRRGPDRRGAPEGALREVRAGNADGVRRGVVRLLRAAHRARDLDDAGRARSSARACTTRSARLPTGSRSGCRSRSIPRRG